MNFTRFRSPRWYEEKTTWLDFKLSESPIHKMNGYYFVLSLEGTESITSFRSSPSMQNWLYRGIGIVLIFYFWLWVDQFTCYEMQIKLIIFVRIYEKIFYIYICNRPAMNSVQKGCLEILVSNLSFTVLKSKLGRDVKFIWG